MAIVYLNPNVDNLDIRTSLNTSALNTSDDCWYRDNNPYYILDKNMSCVIVNSDGTIYLEDGCENSLCIGIRPAVWVKI